MANRLGLHQVVGPVPSVEMLLQDMAHRAQLIHLSLPRRNPTLVRNWSFAPAASDPHTWLLTMDDPSWGNNLEATSSTGQRRPRLQLIRNEMAVSD